MRYRVAIAMATLMALFGCSGGRSETELVVGSEAPSTTAPESPTVVATAPTTTATTSTSTSTPVAVSTAPPTTAPPPPTSIAPPTTEAARGPVLIAASFTTPCRTGSLANPTCGLTLTFKPGQDKGPFWVTWYDPKAVTYPRSTGTDYALRPADVGKACFADGFPDDMTTDGAQATVTREKFFWPLSSCGFDNPVCVVLWAKAPDATWLSSRPACTNTPVLREG